MKFGFSVNINKKDKNNETTETIEKKEITSISKKKIVIKDEITKEEMIKAISKTSNKQTGLSKEDVSIDIEKKDSSLSNADEKIYNAIEEETDNSGNKIKKKKVQFINNSKGTTIDHKTLFLFDKCNYDCKVKFKCMFSIDCIKKAIIKTKDAIVSSVCCVSNTISNAVCNVTKKVTNTIVSGYTNLKNNTKHAFNYTITSIKTGYTNIKTSIYQSVIITKIRNFKHTRFWINTKKYTKNFFIYVFCIWICQRKTSVDKTTEEYKEEYIKNNATYSTEFDHLPILGEDAIV